MPVNDHSELHARVGANVILPDRQLLIASLGQLALSNGAPPAEVVADLASWFKAEGQSPIANNLFKQTSFLSRAKFRGHDHWPWHN